MNNGGAIEFVIDGHKYETTYLDVDAGLSVLSRLVALLGESLVALLENVVSDPAKLARIVKAATTPGDDTKIEDLLGGVTFRGIGRDLGAGLLRVDAAPLVRDLVAKTYRDGKPLRDPGVYNDAFRGNYRELGALALKLIAVNRLFPLPGT